MNKIINHFKTFWYMYVLVAILVVMTIVYGRVIELEEANAHKINKVYYMTDFKSEDFTRISFLGKEGQQLSFIRKDGETWAYEADEALVIDQDGPKYMTELLKKIATEYQVSNAEDISIYGLSEKCPYIEFVAKGETYRMYVGNFNQTVNRYYAHFAGETDVYGITAEVAEILDYTLEDFKPEE